jgi:hypothetical protein
MESKEIEDRFKSHDMDDDQKDHAIWMRVATNQLAHEIDSVMPDCREKSIAITKLEEVSMWAVKGIARNPQ